MTLLQAKRPVEDVRTLLLPDVAAVATNGATLFSGLTPEAATELLTLCVLEAGAATVTHLLNVTERYVGGGGGKWSAKERRTVDAVCVTWGSGRRDFVQILAAPARAELEPGPARPHRGLGGLGVEAQHAGTVRALGRTGAGGGVACPMVNADGVVSRGSAAFVPISAAVVHDRAGQVDVVPNFGRGRHYRVGA